MYDNGIVIESTPAKNIKVYFHVGIKLRNGKNKGVPAQTMVSILIDIVLKRGAKLLHMYQRFNQYKYKYWFHSQKK